MKDQRIDRQVLSDKLTTVRLTIDGEHFEILVRPDPALNHKLGRRVELSQVVAMDEVYSDSSKGLRVSVEKFQKYFNTTDIFKVEQEILKKGELLLTTEQRRTLVEEKKKQIVTLIARNYIDPKTGLPHPPLRIEQAMQEIRVSIEPFRTAEEQSKEVVEALRRVLPLKSERIKLVVKVPPQFAAQSLGVLKSHAEIKKDEWGADGGLTALVEIPAGMHPKLLDRLGAVSKGSAQATLLR